MTKMNYEQALNYIHSSLKFGSKLGLENIRRLLSRLGNPQKNIKIVHIAGTNGKGSTLSYIANALIAEGYKVGTYTSPYILSFNERMQINLKNIPNETLARITMLVKDQIDEIVKEGYLHPTEFEIVTAIAFVYFFEENVDYLILEVGLGGRFDATNVIETPICSVITNIAMDHMQYLGDTLESIAFEKAGIIKEGRSVFMMDQSNEAIETVSIVAKEKCADFYVVDVENASVKSFSLNETIFNYMGISYSIRLLGKHQIKNAILAIRVLEYLGVKNDAIIEGLRNTKWKGRLERVLENPLFLIDGAHNIDAINALVESIKLYFDKKVILIFGVMADKEVEQMVSLIMTVAKRCYCVTADNIRALEANKLADVVKRYCQQVIVSDTIKEAVYKSIEGANRDDVIIACGSLYYIGEVRNILINKA